MTLNISFGQDQEKILNLCRFSDFNNIVDFFYLPAKLSHDPLVPVILERAKTLKKLWISNIYDIKNEPDRVRKFSLSLPGIHQAHTFSNETKTQAIFINRNFSNHSKLTRPDRNSTTPWTLKCRSRSVLRRELLSIKRRACLSFSLIPESMRPLNPWQARRKERISVWHWYFQGWD